MEPVRPRRGPAQSIGPRTFMLFNIRESGRDGTTKMARKITRAQIAEACPAKRISPAFLRSARANRSARSAR